MTDEIRPDAIRDRLRELWSTDASQIAIGKQLGISPNQVNSLRQRMGLPNRGTQGVHFVPAGTHKHLSERQYMLLHEHKSGALEAGHRIAWGAITKGTLLEGVPWPGRAEKSDMAERFGEQLKRPDSGQFAKKQFDSK